MSWFSKTSRTPDWAIEQQKLESEYRAARRQTREGRAKADRLTREHLKPLVWWNR